MWMIMTLAFSVLSYSASNFEYAFLGSTQSYQNDFQTENGRPAPQPYGYFFEKEESEILSTVFFEENRKMTGSIYGCHEHSPGEFDCHRENKLVLGDYSRSSNLYSVEEMKQSLPLAIEFFTQNVGAKSDIVTIKLWEAFSNIRYVMTYKKGETVSQYFIACHFHGNGLDCHRKRDAGPGEPKLP